MRRDFTLEVYKDLLQSLLNAGYVPQTYEQFIISPKQRTVIIRHDVDKKPKNALRVALIEHKFGVKGSYYFRILKKRFDDETIKEVAKLDHEIGYHYEDLCLAGGDVETAARLFEAHLVEIRELYPVRTICMHGSPFEKWDNRGLWDHIDYRDYGIIGEPYLDVNFDSVLYLTDTGRRWDGSSVSIRDKVRSRYNPGLKKTSEIINGIKGKSLPEKIMINTHPQRWSDDFIEWTSEILLQNLKNVFKRILS